MHNGDNRILGAIDIRYGLNDYLYNYGGHIGYGIRPTERKKGYVSEMLSLALDICRENKDTPRWLNEGIACFEAKDNDENWIRNTVKDGLVSDMIPTFKDLDTGDDFETFFKRNGYQYSYTIVESIINEFGYDKLYRLIKSPDNFVDIFNITEVQIQDKWAEYIKKNYLMP